MAKSKAYIKIQHKHERPIDNKDKYYIINIKADHLGPTEVGWIEKEYVEADFIKKSNEHYNFENLEVLKVTEYSKEDYYKFKNK